MAGRPGDPDERANPPLGGVWYEVQVCEVL